MKLALVNLAGLWWSLYVIIRVEPLLSGMDVALVASMVPVCALCMILNRR